MEVRIPAVYFNLGGNTIECEPGGTIIITGDTQLTDNCVGIGWEALCEAVRNNDKPYHLVLENGQKGTSTMGVKFGDAIMGKIISFTAPDLEYIGTLLFSGCNELVSINLPSVTFIQAGAFAMCPKLENVNLPLADFLYFDAFRECKSLKSIDLPKMQEISDRAFMDCVNLKTVNIPDDVEISPSAFTGCRKLKRR